MTEEIRELNAEKIRLAQQELARLMWQALQDNRRGTVGVRIPIQRGKFGNCRRILEDEC